MRHYVVRCDGFTIIDDLYLTEDQYKDQPSRNVVRRKIAKELCVPMHYLRLMQKKTVNIDTE